MDQSRLESLREALVKLGNFMEGRVEEHVKALQLIETAIEDVLVLEERLQYKK